MIQFLALHIIRYEDPFFQFLLMPMEFLDPQVQGGIFQGDLGTRFPQNPWSQAKYLLDITLFSFNIN